MLDVLCSLSNLLIGLIVLWNPFSNNIELSLISLFSTSVCMCSPVARRVDQRVWSCDYITKTHDVTACHRAHVVEEVNTGVKSWHLRHKKPIGFHDFPAFPAMPLPPRKRQE